MESLLDILKNILPAIIALVGVYFVINKFFVREAQKNEDERRLAMRRDSLPLRLQAYERIVLLLERISPNQLILRMSQPGMGAGKFHAVLIQTIRDEFDHNLSQQVYISSRAWELVRNAREEIIRIINSASAQLGKEASSADLASKILELYTGLQDNPLEKAIEYVKQEARQFL